MKINVVESRQRRVKNLCNMLENINIGLSQDSVLQMMIEDYLEEEENIFTWGDIKGYVNDLLKDIKDKPKEAYRSRFGKTYKCYNNCYSDGIEEVDLTDKHVVISGTLSVPRKAFTERLRNNGAIVGTKVNGKTEYLILGKDGGSKVKEAEARNVPIIKEEVVNRWLESIELPQLQEVATESSDPIEESDNKEDIEF